MTRRSHLLTLVVGAAVLLAALAPPLLAQIAPPTISSISPSRAFAGSASFNLAVYGTGFVDNAVVSPQIRSVVLWNGQALSTTYLSSTILTAAVPASLLTPVSTATVRVWNPTPNQYSNIVTFSILTPLSITTSALTAGTAGGNYSQPLTGVGGTQPYSWDWAPATGSLPPGLSLNSQTGMISGIPSGAGTYSILVGLFDRYENLVTKTFPLIINPRPSVSTTSLPNGQVGVAYLQTLTVSGGTGPHTWSLATGQLPEGLSLSSTNGLISGTPTTGGTSSFTVRVTDRYSVSATSGPLAITINPASLTLVTTALGSMMVGTRYSLTLTATGGTPQYRNWRVVAGTLPEGLSLGEETGMISGTPVATGTGIVQISVSDSGNQSSVRVFSWTVSPAQLSVTTASPLPAGTVGVDYSQTFAATGGISPYTWSLTSGALPPGLTLSTAGVLIGTPTQSGTFTFTVTVTDSAKATASRQFVITVNLPAAPALSVTGLTDTVSPAQQPSLDVQLSSAYPLTITGTITLTFTSDAVVPANDPSIQFSSGGRTLNFTIPAGETRAFPTSSPAIQTGTVAGRIDLTLRFTVGGQDITPSPAPTRTVQIPRSAPKINSVQIVRTGGGFSVLVTGYSTPRQVTQAAFSFTAASAGNLQTTQLTVPVDSTFTTWFSGTTSGQFGSSFLYTQPFQVQGNIGAIASVSVTISNATGSSSPVSANF